jgi:ribosomal protein S18 acetylase RimI-like enzyme
MSLAEKEKRSGEVAPHPASTPALSLVSMTEEDAAAICSWRYPPPYEGYEWPPWEMMVERGLEFGHAQIRLSQYLVARTERKELIGFIQLFPLDRAMRLGISLRPDCCSRGWGPLLTSMAVREARHRMPDAEIDLEVETWNERAVKAYGKAGFTITDEYERGNPDDCTRVYCMVWSSDKIPQDGGMNHDSTDP